MTVHWGCFLRDMEQGLLLITEVGGDPITITPADVLAFVTGAMSIPIMGLAKQGILTILCGGGMFPTALTCALVICLPIHEDYIVSQE